MSRDFIGALLQLNAEKGVSREQLVRTVEEAIQSAYRRVEPGNEDVQVSLDIESGKMRVWRAKTAVSEVEDPLTEFPLDEAKQHDPEARLGDLVETEELDASTFGRIHAQTAKQVVLQRLREAEREVVFSQFAERDGEIITGTVSRVEPRGVILEMGKAEAILPTTDQSASEHYRIGQHVKAYVLEVRRTTRGPLIYVSRTHKNFLRRLFELEVPEIHNGTVEIKAIAREAGSRSKVAVSSRQEGLDPVGATVGQRGGRVQAVVAELGGEKIDIIPWNEDPAVFVANALQPAQVVKVDIDEENRIASVTVPERMLSLAIGREGQNARLAAKLTGWRIDIRSDQAPPRETPHPDRPGRSQPAQEEAPAVAQTEIAEPVAIAIESPAEPEAAEAHPAKADAAEVHPTEDEPATTAKPKARATRSKKVAAEVPDGTEQQAAEAATAVKPTARATRSKKGAAEASDSTEQQAAPEPAPKAKAPAPKAEAPAAEGRSARTQGQGARSRSRSACARQANAPQDRRGGVIAAPRTAVPAHHVPTRTCVACRTERPKRDLIRIVRTPEGAVVVDPTGRLSGRGAYLCADGSCWAAALKKSSIERALAVPLPVELRSRIEQGELALISGGS